MNEPHDDTIESLLRRQFPGPVADDGFCDKVMLALPPRRRRIAWPLWLGVLLGAGACGVSLAGVPVLQAGMRDGLAGTLSASLIGMVVVMAAIALLTLVWSLAESGRR